MRDRRVLMAVAALALIVCGSVRGQAATDWQLAKLKGKVRSYRVAAGLVSPSGELQGGLQWIEGREYSPAGYLVRAYPLDGSGSIIESSLHGLEYQLDDGRLTRCTEYQAGKYIGEKQYVYGTDEVLMRTEGSVSDVFSGVTKTVSEYDQRGNITESVWKSEEEPEVRIVFAYDEEGRLITRTAYDDGKVGLVEETEYLPGRTIATQRLPSGDTMKLDSAVDENGFVTEQLTYVRNQLVGRAAFQYEVDSTGNWTKVTALAWVATGETPRYVPQKVTVREITYYE